MVNRLIRTKDIGRSMAQGFKDAEAAKIKALQDRLYDECYIGHVPQEHWAKLARFMYTYGDEQRQVGYYEADREDD